MDAATRQLVRQRASDRCEYCGMPQASTPFLTFHMEHIRAQQHLEDDSPNNLALACPHCNLHKGPNLTSIDLATNDVVELFNPRQQVWADHFRIDEARIVGRTPTGRVTVRLLQMNSEVQIKIRKRLLLRGDF